MGIWRKMKRMFGGGSHHTLPPINGSVIPPAQLPPEAARLQNVAPTPMFQQGGGIAPPMMRPVSRAAAMPDMPIIGDSLEDLAKMFATKSRYGNSVLENQIAQSGYQTNQLGNYKRLAFIAYGKNRNEMQDIIKATEIANRGNSISREEYQMASSVLAPYLQQLMNTDLDKMNKLSDKKLMGKMGELNEVMMPAMHIADLAKYLKNPDTGKTLKDEVIGTVGSDTRKTYDRKSGLLRALHDTARGNLLMKSLNQLQKQNGAHSLLPEDYFSAIEYNNIYHQGNNQRQFINDMIDKGARNRELNKKK